MDKREWRRNIIPPLDKLIYPIYIFDMFIRYALLADTVTFDNTGKASAIGIFDRVFAVNFPTMHRDMTLLVNLEGTIAEKGEHPITVELRDRDGNRLVPPVEAKVVLGNPHTVQGIVRAGIALKMQDVLFRKPGQYEYVLFADSRFLGRVTFEVQQLRERPLGEA